MLRFIFGMPPKTRRIDFSKWEVRPYMKTPDVAAVRANDLLNSSKVKMQVKMAGYIKTGS